MVCDVLHAVSESLVRKLDEAGTADYRARIQDVSDDLRAVLFSAHHAECAENRGSIRICLDTRMRLA